MGQNIKVWSLNAYPTLDARACKRQAAPLGCPAPGLVISGYVAPGGFEPPTFGVCCMGLRSCTLLTVLQSLAHHHPIFHWPALTAHQLFPAIYGWWPRVKVERVISMCFESLAFTWTRAVRTSFHTHASQCCHTLPLCTFQVFQFRSGIPSNTFTARFFVHFVLRPYW